MKEKIEYAIRILAMNSARNGMDDFDEMDLINMELKVDAEHIKKNEWRVMVSWVDEVVGDGYTGDGYHEPIELIPKERRATHSALIDLTYDSCAEVGFSNLVSCLNFKDNR